jgi:hypothetical protein
VVNLANAVGNNNRKTRPQIRSGGFEEKERFGGNSVAEFFGVLCVVAAHCDDLLSCLPKSVHSSFFFCRLLHE